VLLLPKLADSLAGRMEVLRLHPLAQAELAGKESRFLANLFSGSFKLRPGTRLGSELADRIVAGGYPAALVRTAGRRRSTWYRDYLDSLVQRDLRDLARISSINELPRLLTLAATQTARLVNVAELAAPFHLSRPTIRSYLTLLTQVFLVEELPPWHSNRLSRLVKTPKLHLCDSGLACALMNVGAEDLRADRTLLGQLLETFVLQELRRHASWYDGPVHFHHFRDKDGVEVDIVLETSGQRIAGVEVKASSTVTAADFRSLRKLQASVGKRFAGGVVLYDGETAVPFGEGCYAVPIKALWE
jgi:predicted AAA+ superfamily ATPase